MTSPTKFSVEQLQTSLLSTLDTSGGSIPDTRDLHLPSGQKAGSDADLQTQIKGALDSLADRDMVHFSIHATEQWSIAPEGQETLDKGSPEFRVWQACGDSAAGLSIKDLQAKLGPEVTKLGQANAFKRKWISKQGDTFAQSSADVQDTTRADLTTIQQSGTLPDTKLLQEYKKRTLVATRKLPYYSVQKGPKFALQVPKLETDLTAEMIQSGAWKNASFKKYNFDAEGAPPAAGAFHPLMKVREEFRHIFFDMGFEEMPTNKFVESSFWCFDALFVPQQHPARELQDTFYIKDPVASGDIPKDYMERVRQVHESGGYESIGYRYPWKKSETEKLVLRTHTTSISANMLYKLAQSMKDTSEFKPAKFFSIDRVFRNEAVDATHLAEFHQVEGVVADYNITLGDLIGFMDIFFRKMGITQLRFKPAYNPYTEPSLEIFSYHLGLKKWVEIGNSGMFRPEMLEPMGLPKDVRVLGWGLSLERPTMIRYGLKNIRDLVGHKVPVEMVESSAAVRF